MSGYDDVCVLVPTYQEAPTVGDVVERFRAEGFETVLVVDGGSTDGTRERAREAGARVVRQSGSGKGQAVREALEYVAEPYVLLVDGDATYRPEDAHRMVEPLRAGEADHVIGDRFADMQPGAMSRLNKVGNRLINWAFRSVHGEDYGDILSGYRAFSRTAVQRLLLTADGFGIETELAVECSKHDLRTRVVPITYEPRPAGSSTNLSPFRDGAVILLTLYQMAKTNNPLFYFGSVGAASGLVGLVLAGYVAVEWVTRSVSHEVIAVVAGVTILFGVQLVLFGVLADLVVEANREQTRRLEQLAREAAGAPRPDETTERTDPTDRAGDPEPAGPAEGSGSAGPVSAADDED